MTDHNHTRAAAPPLRPFLKWAGNKFRLVERIAQRLPAGRRLIEPFAGSGALFLNTNYDDYLLSDANRDLFELYTRLRDEGKGFIEEARRYFSAEYNNEESFYALREEFNATSYSERRAILFLYLNRHGYNGLCRYNAKGKFNVPFGRYKRPYFPLQEMRTFHQKAQRAEFKCASFEQTMSEAREGDVIYCDPPYVPLSTSANFTSYSAGGFSMAQQQQLAELARDNARRGIPVLISNHSTELTRRLYTEAGGQCGATFAVKRHISCNGLQRDDASELLALFSPETSDTLASVEMTQSNT
ncbi:MAG: Dam family site-specific DNA-(adenine-N6)-methyltransferase [Gammaproteobacteria bacterium]|nr:Dam family site-specific DNA-(adenine-N6)-methyltransferase [Gammaproteobacteria bacterium]